MKYILASASPRRQQLLALVLDGPFEVQVSDADEGTALSDPAELVQELAKRKARAVAEGQEEAVIFGADTVVALEGQILGKPKDRQQAKAMLEQLSGKTHTVYTGIALLHTQSGHMLCEADSTQVTFAPMRPEEIEAYLDTGEYADKAGAYGIQGGAAKHIEKIDGCYFNVMGLPVHRTYELLKKLMGESDGAL